jgi:thymidylate synthase ThyX
MSQKKGIPSIVKEVVKEMVEAVKKESPYLFEDFGFNFELLSWYPAAQLYSPRNETLRWIINSFDKKEEVILISHNSTSLQISEETITRAVKDRDEAEISNLKHIHFEFFILISLAGFHQAIRQRTWNHSIESIYDASREALKSEERMAVPPSIKNSEFYLEYKNQHSEMLKLYQELIDYGVSEREAIGVIPHSVKVYDFIHVNGWNAIHSIGKRTCTTAQWEIRKIAKKIAEIIKEKMPSLGKWAEPQCITYGKCPETKDCGYYKKYQA